MSGDVHTPTHAGPGVPAQPTPTVPPSAGSSVRPAGSPLPPSVPAAGAEDDRPEILAGAAFAGGLILATILKRFGRHD